ncbi:RNA polymerase sigma factor SigI [Virgibacillus halodenitrificans]|uniref:RNA polymerase sigma factor SigI n=1 Tax=Virgibacillus halodenitrificans TaxID=1482 RepID=A0ABR7VIC3_VIRHA|nr:RNA polymerase sigma factor SigI [Virgibacillus halodenitrificans]MBD1221679.1 RNA polymerase sigma factor SigI [Virgibacillus halodenitrificans]MCG1029437.1 RNA polymerase sigma factor SigI [Virgibacillus halodenitrificans]MCJ0932213.1 RNA polymerase sigma factor SigI [Virgibacillus halodenitrificans]MEC2160665.1 RNA polymerase sigma factor SigI [Virgibacillus halodenitrificans]MYL46870.1 RNA polymerase sigma factor SigI [Virgibacillus halodenitrificans]
MSKSLKDIPLEEMIASAQQGDELIQNYLLKTYQPFIAKCVSEVCKRYIDPKKDDEFSIGLSAFNEAILSYSPDKGSSFLSFANLVVKRKVIDYIRYVQKRPLGISLDETYDAELMENPIEIVAVKRNFQMEQDAWRRKEEIMDFKEKLKEYKLTLLELTESSPKHKDARDSAVRTARILFEDEKLHSYVLDKKKLPIKDLIKRVNVSKKTLERNRKFILAIFVVLSNDYVYLQDYLKGVGQ